MTETTPDPLDTPDPAPTEPAPSDQPPDGNTEAKKYRLRLRDTEAERDTLTARVSALQRSEVLRLAGQHLTNAEDLLVHKGEDLTGYLTDDGTVDPAQVQATVAELIGERAYLARRRLPMPNPAQGSGGSGEPGEPEELPGFVEVFRAARRK
jgi:hypothetical protein